jgi:hypothetical protein
MGTSFKRLLAAAALSAAMLLPLGVSAPAASAQGIACTLNNFLLFGAQACPVGTLVSPQSFLAVSQGTVVNPQGFLVTPQGTLLTPQGAVVTPTGHVLNSLGQEVVSHGELVSCVARRAPQGNDERHGQIVSAVARSADNGAVGDAEAAAFAAQCLLELGNPVFSATGALPGFFPNRDRGDDDDDDDRRRGRGRGNHGNNGERGRGR